MPQRLGDHHDLDWPAADSAYLFRERSAEDAQFVGEPAPDVGLPSRAGLGGGTTLFEVVACRQELAEAVAQQFLFFAQIEVHLKPQSRFGENVPLNFVATRV